MVPFLDPFWDRFWSTFEVILDANLSPRLAQAAPRWAKTGLDDAKVGPYLGEEGAKTSSDEPRWSPDWPSGATPKNLEKRVPRIALFWIPKLIQNQLKNWLILGPFLTSFRTHFGSTFGVILRALLDPKPAEEAPREAQESQRELQEAKNMIFERKVFSHRTD